AWRQLCHMTIWDADLFVVGDGRALPRWKSIVEQSELRHRVRFLGFTEGIAEFLAAADVLVSPVRYESYGLNVQEALCRGVPAIVSANAGVTECYSHQLSDLLLPDPEDVGDLVQRLIRWREHIDEWRQRVVQFSTALRGYSWQDMAERFYALATGNTCELM